MTINIILVAALIVAALWTVMTARLLRAVVALAVTSVLVTVLMFRLSSPIAGVFELSVCAGLIPAILITTVGLTERLSGEALAARRKQKLRKFWPLPFLVIIVAVLLTRLSVRLEPAPMMGGAYNVWVHATATASDAEAKSDFKRAHPAVSDQAQDAIYAEPAAGAMPASGRGLTIGACKASTWRPVGGDQVTLSGASGRVRAQDDSETIKITLGMRDASGNWIGDPDHEPTVVWTGKPGRTAASWSADTDARLAIPTTVQNDVRQSLWIARNIDLLGQVVVLLGGALAVVVLVRGNKVEPQSGK